MPPRTISKSPFVYPRLQMFVFGEVQDPTTETVNLVEDIVRGQIIELVRIHTSHSHVMSIYGTLTEQTHSLQSYPHIVHHHP